MIKKRKTNKKKLLKEVLISPVPNLPPMPVTYHKAMEIAQQAINSSKLSMAKYQLSQLAEHFPAQAETKILLLQCLGFIGSTDELDKIINDMLSRFPANCQVLIAIAHHYTQSGHGQKALPLLEKCLKISPTESAIFVGLGRSHSALGNKTEAIEAYNKALKMDPYNGSCYFSRALLLKSNASDEQTQAMEKTLCSGKMDKGQQAMLHLATAWCYDKKDIDKQFDHLHQGNRLMAEVHPTNIETSKQRLKELTQFINQDLVSVLSNCGDQQQSPIFIAAMPRSGTTLLEQILGAHSMTHPIGESQITAFSIDQLSHRHQFNNKPYSHWSSADKFKKFIPEFNECFKNNAHVIRSNGKRIVDKSLDNFRHVGLNLLMHPNAKIIHLNRHPLDTILSIYQLYIKAGSNFPWQLEDLAEHYLVYKQYMDYWKSIFPDNILTINYEELVDKQEETTKKIVQFCDLEWENSCLEFYKKEETVNTPSVMQVKQPINKQAVERWKPYAKHLKPAADILGISC